MVILSLVVINQLLLRNKQIPLHQPSNFVYLLSNHSGSGTILFSITVYFNAADAGANTVYIISSDVSVLVVLFLSEIYSLVILNVFLLVSQYLCLDVVNPSCLSMVSTTI